MNLRATAKSLVMAGLMLVAGGVLISCMPNTEAPTLQPRPKSTDQPVRAEPDPTATLRAALPPFTDGACLDCHTDKDQLVALAKPPKETESLSEGPG